MTDSTSSLLDAGRVRRISRVAAVMTVVCTALAVATPAIMALVWLNIERLPRLPVPRALVADLSFVDRAGGFALSLIAAGVAVWGLVSLAALFRRFRRGDILDARAAVLLQRFAIAVLVLPVARIAGEGLTTAWLSRDAPPGERMVSLSLSSDDLLFVVVGVLLLTIAWVLRDAAAIADENRQIF